MSSDKIDMHYNSPAAILSLMKWGVIIFLNIFVYFFVTAPYVSAESSVIISEYSPLSSPEWVELYNTTDNAITLTDWFIDDINEGGSSPKKFTLTLPAHGFNFVDLTNIFNNTGGDSVRLLDPTQTVIDETTYTEVVDEKTYNRVSLTKESLFCLASPTKNNINEPCTLTPTPTIGVSPTEAPTATPSATPTITLTPAASTTPVPTVPPTPTPTPTMQPTIKNIYLSEALPNPDNAPEWVELYNDNDHEVTLTNWYIDDTENEGATPKKIDITIPARSFAVVEFTGSLFNNAGDQIRLLDPSKKEVDSTEYINAPKSTSYSRQDFTDEPLWCFGTLSKNAKNEACAAPVSSPLSTTTHSTASQKSVKSAPIVPDTFDMVYTPPNIFQDVAPVLLFFKTPEKASILGAHDNAQNTTVNYLPLMVLFAFTAVSSLAFFSYLVYRIYNEEKETFLAALLNYDS